MFTKDELLRDVWGYRGRLVTRTVDSHASRLRRKLRAAGAELTYVVNVWGRGYRLLEYCLAWADAFLGVWSREGESRLALRLTMPRR